VQVLQTGILPRCQCCDALTVTGTSIQNIHDFLWQGKRGKLKHHRA